MTSAAKNVSTAFFCILFTYGIAAKQMDLLFGALTEHYRE